MGDSEVAVFGEASVVGVELRSIADVFAIVDISVIVGISGILDVSATVDGSVKADFSATGNVAAIVAFSAAMLVTDTESVRL